MIKSYFLKAVFLVLAVISIIPPVKADEVFVKYRGMVDLKHFSCPQIKDSSLVNIICYDEAEKYLLVNLNGTFYHYCGLNEIVYQEWLKADSLGKFYGSRIKGNYDCRVTPPPIY